MNARQNRCSMPSAGRTADTVNVRMAGLLFLMLIYPLAVHGLGFRIPNLDAESTAKGNAVIATADNPSALYYNPAGITQIEGTEVQVGFHAIHVNSHFEADAGGDWDTKFEVQAVPQLYLVTTPKDKLYSFGLGLYAPYGLGLQWPGDAPLRNQGIEGRLAYFTVSPIMALQVLPSLSIAAGPTINYSQIKLRRGIGLVPDDVFRFTGDGWAFGAKAGLRWQPFEKWAFGASYVSPTTVDFEGGSQAKPETKGKRPTTATVDFPQFAMGGISYRPSAKWNMEVGLDWTDWGKLNTVTFENTAFGNVPFALNWHTSFMVYSGVERYLNNHYWVALGYFYSGNSTTDKDFSPLIPDTDLHVASIGFGRRGPLWSWAVSGQVITGPSRTIKNGNGADGTYQFFNQALNFSVARKF